MKFTNKEDIPIALAVWLLHDEYDYNFDEKYISATSLLKSTQQIILSDRARKLKINTEMDISELIASSLGTAIHDSIEKAWYKGYKTSLRKLGIPEKEIEKVVINPDVVEEGQLPIYMEIRSVKEIGGYKVGGKFDFVFDGQVQDHKSTSAWSWVFGTKDEDYIIQGSIYKWLNPDIITKDTMQVNFIFTDWSKAQATSNPNYPKSRLEKKELELLSNKATENWIERKLKEIDQYFDEPQGIIPECNDEELWRSETVYKYYRNPDGKRATRNFKNLFEAQQYMHSTGKGQGVIKTVPGEPKACHYCPAFDICEQRKRLLPDD